MSADARAGRFWSQLGHSSEEVVQRFVNRLQDADEDVIMFTARKAACFADALRLTGAWVPHNELCSDEAIELETKWLTGRRVLVVDDIIGTGQTLDTVLAKLEKCRVESLRVLYIASSAEWPHALNALQRRHPRVEFTPSPTLPDTASGIAQQLVSCFAAVPRPYNLDWPLLGGWTLSRSQLDAFIAHLGWRSRSTTSSFHGNLGIRTLVLEPPRRMIAGLLERLDAPGAEVGLHKIRLYAEPIDADRFNVAVMPILAFDRIPTRSLTPLLRSLGVDHTIGAASRIGRARIANYAAALRLGRDFESLPASRIVNQRLVESHWQRALALGPKVNFSVRQTEGPPVDHPPVSLRAAARASIPPSEFEESWPRARFCLTRFLWDGSRRAERSTQRLAVKGASADVMDAFIGASYRQPGYRVSDLASQLDSDDYDYGHLAHGLVSAFLDDAIDSGMTVPSLRESGGYVERVFRAGETIAFGLREQRLLWVMLNELDGELKRLAKEETNGAQTIEIGRILLEKILVLAVRYGSEVPGLLHPAQLGDALPALTVAYSRYGSIATTDPDVQTLPIANMATHTLGRELHELGLIDWSRDASQGTHKVLTVRPCPLDGAAREHEAAFRGLGSLLAAVLHGRSVSNPDFDSFVILCNRSQVPLALGAEVKLVLSDFSRAGRQIASLPQTLAPLRSRLGGDQAWIRSLVSGLDKLDALARNVVEVVPPLISESLIPPLQPFWDEVVAVVSRGAGSDESDELVRSIAEWLIDTARHTQIARQVVGRAKRSSEIDLVDLAALANSLGLPQPNLVRQTSAKQWSKDVEMLAFRGESLLEEVAVTFDETAHRAPPVRYRRALLAFCDDEVSADDRESVVRSLGALRPYQAGLVAPLPGGLLGPRVAGFAIREREMEIADLLYPQLRRIRGLRSARFALLRDLGPTRRVLRNEFSGNWHGAGFKRMLGNVFAVVESMDSDLIVVDDLLE